MSKSEGRRAATAPSEGAEATLRREARRIYETVFRDPPAYTDYYFDRLFEPGDFVALRGGNEILSSLHAIPRTCRYRGESRPTLFLFAVATELEKRGRGHMGRLLGDVLAGAWAKGIRAVFLAPIDGRIYAKYGFRWVSELARNRIATRELRLSAEWAEKSRDPDLRARAVPDEVESGIYRELSAIYEAIVRDRTLSFDRDEGWYRLRHEELKRCGGRLTLFYRGNLPTGYFIRESEGDLQKITEFLFTDEACAALALRLLGTERDYYGETEIETPADTDLQGFLDNREAMVTAPYPAFMAAVAPHMTAEERRAFFSEGPRYIREYL